MIENEISESIIASAIEVHKVLGPGLLEKAYHKALSYSLKKKFSQIEDEKLISIKFDQEIIESGYRIDILVENKVVIEIKSVDSINDLHIAQTLTYLKLGNFKLGLILNFNVKFLRLGIKRVVYNL